MIQNKGGISGSREPDPSCTGSGPTGFDPGRDDRPKIVELFGHLNQSTTPLAMGPRLSAAAVARLEEMERMDLRALVSACHFLVGAPVTYHDEEGAHDPCYVVLPGGAMLELNHFGDEHTDVARAVFIVRACNAALAIATEAGTAETENTGSVHEGAGRNGIAQHKGG